MHKRQLSLTFNSCMLVTIRSKVLCVRAWVHTDISTLLYGRGNLAQLLWWEGGEISLPACSQSQRGLLFFSVQLSALVWQLAAYIEVDFTERDRRGYRVGGMHFCEAECDNQALCQCQKAERERFHWLQVRHAYHWSSMSLAQVWGYASESPWGDGREKERRFS